MKSLQELKDYAVAIDDWYITNKIWHIEQEIKIEINKAKIEVYKQIDKNNEL
jgi:hypothetical protein|tara:strand:- start:156 stop:311 length:156 start_codon:yes stop_codon:yes gene_type:complete